MRATVLWGRSRHDPQCVQAYREHTQVRTAAVTPDRRCSRCRKRAPMGRWIDFKFVCLPCQEQP